MKYLDNLIAWGDNLFRQDTIESINEATQLYVLAANLLGQRPQRIPPQGIVRPKTFAAAEEARARRDGQRAGRVGGQVSASAWAHPLFAATIPTPPHRSSASDARSTSAFRATTSCCGYWDTVADRLFKIRHCMNIEGVVRQLALFEPPIDPACSSKRRQPASTSERSSRAPTSRSVPVRALLLIQKALELCGEVRSLGRRAARRHREGRRRTPGVFAAGARDQDPADAAGRAVPAVEPRRRRRPDHCSRREKRRWSSCATTSASSGCPPTPPHPTTCR